MHDDYQGLLLNEQAHAIYKQDEMKQDQQNSN